MKTLITEDMLYYLASVSSLKSLKIIFFGKGTWLNKRSKNILTWKMKIILPEF